MGRGGIARAAHSAARRAAIAFRSSGSAMAIPTATAGPTKRTAPPSLPEPANQGSTGAAMALAFRPIGAAMAIPTVRTSRTKRPALPEAAERTTRRTASAARKSFNAPLGTASKPPTAATERFTARMFPTSSTAALLCLDASKAISAARTASASPSLGGKSLFFPFEIARPYVILFSLLLLFKKMRRRKRLRARGGRRELRSHSSRRSSAVVRTPADGLLDAVRQKGRLHLNVLGKRTDGQNKQKGQHSTRNQERLLLFSLSVDTLDWFFLSLSVDAGRN